MSVLASLIAALERAGGERLVLRTGETPHILSGGTRHDLGTAKASLKALEALAEQILSPDARRELAEKNATVEPLSEAVSPIPLLVGTHRSGDQIHIELCRVSPTAAPPAMAASVAGVEPAVEPQPAGTTAPSPVAALVPPTSAIDTPPASEERGWEPIEVPPAVGTASTETAAEPEPAPTVAATDAISLPEPGGEAADAPAPEAAEVAEAAGARVVEAAKAETAAEVPATEAAAAEPPPAETPAAETPALEAAAQEEEAGAEGSVAASRPLKVVPINSTTARLESAETVPEERQAASDSQGRSDATALEYWIRQAVRRDATALYLRSGHAPVVRARQKIQPLTEDTLDRPVIDAVTAALAAGENGWQTASPGEWVRALAGLGEVTCQAFTDDLGTGLVVHLRSQGFPSTLQKDLPRQVRRACEADDGIVIVAGQTIPDMMQMVAAVGEWTAQRRAGYLISIEPPNGLGHNISGILVSARRIAGTERDVATAIRRATQEEPDILVIAMASGSITEEAICATKPGRLVIVGALAPTAPQAIDAFMSGVSRESEDARRRSFASSFRCALSYHPLPGRSGGRSVVHDVLLNTSEVRAQLERWDLGAIEKLQRAGAGGLRSLDAALAGAVHRGDVSLRRAAGVAIDRGELVRLVREAARARTIAARDVSGDQSRRGVHDSAAIA